MSRRSGDSSPLTPHRTPSIPTKHLRSTFPERVSWKLEELQGRWHQICRLYAKWCWFVTLPNIAALVVIGFAIFFGLLHKTERVQREFGVIPFSQRETANLQLAIEELQGQVRVLEHDRSAWMLRIEESLRSLKRDMYRFEGEEEKFSNEMKKMYSDMNQFDDKTIRLKQDLSLVEQRMAKLEDDNRVEKNKIAAANKESRVTNLASRKSGASIVLEATSPQYFGESFMTRVSGLFRVGHSSYEWPIMDRSVISQGEAYCFQGSAGNFTIRLFTKSTVDAIEYEHDFWSATIPVSAPHKYSVYTCQTEDCRDPAFQVECAYEEAYAKVDQRCKLPTPVENVQSVQLRVTSNYGQAYTCLYKVRVLNYL